MSKANGTGLHTSTGDYAHDLATLRAELARVEQQIRIIAKAARDQGQTWADIGGSLGVTKQAAQQRFGTKPAPPVDHSQLVIPLGEVGDGSHAE